jgi:hypothetical protein
VVRANPDCENCETAPEGTKWYRILKWIKKMVIAYKNMGKDINWQTIFYRIQKRQLEKYETGQVSETSF